MRKYNIGAKVYWGGLETWEIVSFETTPQDIVYKIKRDHYINEVREKDLFDNEMDWLLTRPEVQRFKVLMQENLFNFVFKSK